jgi:rod shape-determining protein MreD
MRLRRTAADRAETAWPSAGELARLGAALLGATLLQTTVAPNIRILGANPDFALIIVVCVALVKGSEMGAVFGFFTGTLVAVALMEPFGLSAFVFVLVGFLAGRYRETADLSAGFAPLVSVFSATFLANVLLAMAQFLLARQVPLGFLLGRVLVPSLILNTLLAAPLYVLVRVWLRGAGDLRAVTRARL